MKFLFSIVLPVVLLTLESAKTSSEHDILHYPVKRTGERTFNENNFLELSDDFEESPSLTGAINYDTESIPPWIMMLLAQKMKQQREREERTRKTPRLGRDIEDEIDTQRSRPPFSPRLGKKSVPFKPRLGRSFEETRC